MIGLSIFSIVALVVLGYITLLLMKFFSWVGRVILNIPPWVTLFIWVGIPAFMLLIWFLPPEYYHIIFPWFEAPTK